MNKTCLELIRRTVSFVLLMAAIVPSMGIWAQRKPSGKTSASNKAPAAAPKCSGAWTGTITYTRTQSQNDNKRIERVSGRGYDTRDWQMKYDYKAQVAVIESPERNGSSEGRATINHSFSSIEKVDGSLFISHVFICSESPAGAPSPQAAAKPRLAPEGLVVGWLWWDFRE